MSRVIAMCLEAGIASILLIPAFTVLNKRCFHDRNRTILYLVFALYLAAMDAVVGLPNIQFIRFEPNINLKPFQYMFSDYENSFLNVLLFMPLGFFLPVLWQRFRKLRWTVLFGLCTSLLIETLQLFTFRATDVNDLMTNTLGTILGWAVARILLRLAPSIRPWEDSSDLYWVCGVTFAIGFFLQPFLANILWALFLK